MKEITSERAIGNWLRNWCHKKGHRIIKYNPSNQVGFPDRIIMTETGNVWFVELKSKGGILKPMQFEWAKWLSDHNHKYVLIDRIDENLESFLDGAIT